VVNPSRLAYLDIMIISRGRKYIFVHAPKTGGTALALALEARAMKDDILIGDTPKARRRRRRLRALDAAGRLWKHSTLADVEGVISQAEMEAYFVVTLVRNPWDRMVSYYHWLRDQRFDHPAVVLARRSTFGEFLDHGDTRNTMMAWPYGRYVTDGSGREYSALFIRLEALAKDIVPFEEHLGFSLAPLPRVNASRRELDYRQYYTAQTAAIVERCCAADIARFGYRF